MSTHIYDRYVYIYTITYTHTHTCKHAHTHTFSLTHSLSLAHTSRRGGGSGHGTVWVEGNTVHVADNKEKLFSEKGPAVHSRTYTVTAALPTFSSQLDLYNAGTHSQYRMA